MFKIYQFNGLFSGEEIGRVRKMTILRDGRKSIVKEMFFITVERNGVKQHSKYIGVAGYIDSCCG